MLTWEDIAVRRFTVLLTAVTALLVVTEIAALLGLVPHLAPLSLHALLTNPLFAIGFGCPVVLHISRWPARREVISMILLGVVASLLVGLAAGQMTAIQAVIGFGIASAAILGRAAMSRNRDVRREALLYLLPSLVALIFTLEVAMFLEFISRYHALTFDALAYVADCSFGSAIAFDTGRLFRAHPVIAAICTIIYLAPPPALIFVYALQVKRKPHPPVDIITLLLLAGGIGYALYFLFPVSGPGFAFASFPFHPPDPHGLIGTLLPVKPAPRNAVPSLHMASALMAWTWARRYGRWPSVVAIVFVIGTFLATMGMGEHYFFDLVVAMPFTIGVQALLVPRIQPMRRFIALGSSASIFVTWLKLARHHGGLLLDMPVVAWILLAITLVGYVAGERLIVPPDDAVTSSVGP
jgi:hypothetical protein